MTLPAALPPLLETSGEMPFLLHELFFSRTDDRGVILSGNSIFERVSGFSMAELIGAPHKIVRHPDMPKAVFWLLWDTIKAGKPMGAYVKNRTEDGRYYWVFAIVTPLEDGFTSVRFKPTSQLLQKVGELYREVRSLERSSDIEPKESAEILTKMLQDIGYTDYKTFMAYAIAEETAARNAGLGRVADRNLNYYAAMRSSLEMIGQSAHEIVSGFKGIQTSPMNMRIKAARMGDIAAPLTAILSNFDILTDKVRSSIDAFLTSSKGVLATVNEGLFVNCANDIQLETIARFRPDDDPEQIEVTQRETTRLRNLNATYTQKNKASLHNIRIEISSFLEMVLQLKRTLSGLSVTRILCQIESARLDDPTGGMSEVVTQLHQFQELTYRCLLAIEHESTQLSGDIDEIVLNIERKENALQQYGFPGSKYRFERRATVRPEG